MYDATAILYAVDGRTYDANGNEKLTFSTKEVFVRARGVYHAEFYEAAQNGLHPSINLTIANRADYNGEMLVEFDGKMYNVIRVDWVAEKDSVSLVLEERVDPV